MARKDSSEYWIEDPAQIRVLVSPVRMELLDAVAGSGPCSVADLAEEMGRPADSLYYHVKKLVEVGLLVPAGSRERGGRTESLYATPAPRMFIDHAERDDQRRRLLADAASAMLRLTDRHLRHAYLAGEEIGEQGCRLAASGRNRGWLTRKELREVNQHLKRLAEIYFRAEKRPGAILHSFSFALAPVPVGRRRRGVGEEEDGPDSDEE